MSGSFPERVDAIVVGAGPGGLTAARALRDGGAEVLLVEARTRIGAPLRCGELAPTSLFELMGFERRDSWVRRDIIDPTHPMPMVALHRPNAEFEIAGLLAERGVTVHAGASLVGLSPFDGGRTATIRTRDREHRVHAGVVVAADGLSSQTARLAGAVPRLRLDELVPCVGVRLADADITAPDQVVFEWSAEVKPFYIFYIPTGEREIQVAVGRLGARGHATRLLLEHILKDSFWVRGGRVIEHIVGVFPSTSALETPFADGLLIVGAAARMVDASSGEGIWYAAASGAEAAATYLEAGADAPEAALLAGYRERLTKIYKELDAGLQRRRANER